MITTHRDGPTGSLCQACGGAIRDRPATAALAPDGRATWWLHRDLADCLKARRAKALEATHAHHD